MATKLGSEFLKEFDHYERPILFGRTKRQVLFTTGLVLAIGISIGLYFLKFPDLVTFTILIVLLFPIFMYGTKKDIEIRERYRFRLTKQTRSYLTDHPSSMAKLTKNDFTRKKGVNPFETKQS
ncbi:PrgI family protein [Streptococcus uberis]|uniref:PrgI family protein n=1 Tax=Streptococcus uberis TaxID=1349 RepID=UPI0027DE5EE6|nr:PrgI family protein [Streptococcus uberis]MCK1169226.1 PrgI family protein [Streptococcus uberis]MCK1207412.1 PrgI family protein [Streptococcus uberis]MCK1242561.1 PrgI family protein [Streptococcus uberis]